MRKIIRAFSILLLIALSFSCTNFFDEAKYTSHKITIDENIENGSVTADTESAIADTEITLIVKPNNGYDLESLTVKDADENNVTTTVDAEDNTLYKFKMPASDVTVSAVFGLIKSEGTISFATTTISKTTADSAFANTLTKTGDGTVTYSSSDTNVATVDETTGMVTIKGEGTCEITATVQDSETYTYTTKTASYTLTVAEYVEVETYHEDFTSTRFYYVKDVYRTEGNGYVEVRTPSNPFVSSAKTRTQTTSSDWTEGSYVTLTKNDTTATFKSKTVTTYTSILYTKQSDGTYKTKVLGTDVKIDGIGEYGFLTLAGGETGVYYGTFFYTNKGWEASSNGKKSLKVNYDLITPTYQEIENYLKK